MPPFSYVTAKAGFERLEDRVIWMGCTFLPLKVGEERYVASVCVDVTELKIAEQVARDREALFQLIIDNAPMLIYALTTGGRANGSGPRLVALEKATGRELASADLPGIAIGSPMTYLAGGRQFIALTVQGATPREVPSLVALSLP